MGICAVYSRLRLDDAERDLKTAKWQSANNENASNLIGRETRSKTTNHYWGNYRPIRHREPVLASPSNSNEKCSLTNVANLIAMMILSQCFFSPPPSHLLFFSLPYPLRS